MKSAAVVAAVLGAVANSASCEYQPPKLRGPAASDQVAR
jgi:hypothetical protein